MSPEIITMADGAVALHRHVFGASEARRLFDELHRQCTWRQAEIRLFGRCIPSPRLTAWYGERPYTYSNLTWPAADWPPLLVRIKDRVEAKAGAPFNGVLANLYRDGGDSMGWHSDDEASLGEHPVIASLSLGATRRFVFRRRDDKRRKREVALPDDSLMIMSGTTQAYWQHALPRTAKPLGPRLNLTFRKIL